MAFISLIKIQEEHTKNPKSFANTALQKNLQAYFYINNGSICCPHSFIPLETGTVAIVTHCCRRVFNGEVFARYAMAYEECPGCRAKLSNISVKVTCLQGRFISLFENTQ